MLQSSQVLSFFQARERGDWSQRELAEFYRVEDALTKSGVGISTDRGITDEGEPWFIFVRQDNEEVIVHFARIGGEYVIASNFTEIVVRGRNFQALVRELLNSYPYFLPKHNSSGSTVFLHPATMLAALVVTGYIKGNELSASADDGSRPAKSFGWFLDRHDLATTYSAIVIASVWDTLAINSLVSKPFDDLASLDHAQSTHGEHGSYIESAVASDSRPQNIHAFHGTDDRSTLTAALNLDGHDTVPHVNEPALAGLVANPSGFHPELSHPDNAASSSTHDVSHAENCLVSKLAVFRPQQGDYYSIAANEQVERNVINKPVSSSAPPSPTPDNSASHHVSTTPVIASSDTTTTPDDLPSTSHVEDTIHPLNVQATNATQLPVLTPQPVVTILASVLDPQPEATIQAPLADSQPGVTSQAPALNQQPDVTIQAPLADSQPGVTSQAPMSDLKTAVTLALEPAAQVNYAALQDNVTANGLEVSGRMQAFSQAEDSSTLSIVGIDLHHTAAALG
jgi:hypothetical protein